MAFIGNIYNSDYTIKNSSPDSSNLLKEKNNDQEITNIATLLLKNCVVDRNSRQNSPTQDKTYVDCFDEMCSLLRLHGKAEFCDYDNYDTICKINDLYKNFVDHLDEINSHFVELSRRVSFPITHNNFLQGLTFLLYAVRYILNEKQEKIYPIFLSHISFQIIYNIIKGLHMQINMCRNQGGLSRMFEVSIGGLEFMAKYISKTKLFMREFRVYFENHHPNIAVLLGTNHQRHIIFIEKYQGTPLTLSPMVLGTIYKIVKALKYLAKRKVIHGDIKRENIIVTNDGEPHLIDFNLSQKIGENRHQLGTRTHTPIEMFYDDTPVTDKTDVWCLGYTIFDLYSTYPKYKNLTMREILEEAQKKDPKRKCLPLPCFEPGHFPITSEKENRLPDLVNKMMCYKPNKRISWEDIPKHSVFGDSKEEKEEEENASSPSSTSPSLDSPYSFDHTGFAAQDLPEILKPIPMKVEKNLNKLKPAGNQQTIR